MRKQLSGLPSERAQLVVFYQVPVHSNIYLNMNKIISTDERVFKALVGPSGSRKSNFIFQMLTRGTFQPGFDKIIYFYQHYQELYNQMSREIPNIEFVGSLDFEMIENIETHGKKYLLIFDDVREKIAKAPE